MKLMKPISTTFSVKDHRIEAESYSKTLAPSHRSGELSQELKSCKVREVLKMPQLHRIEAESYSKTLAPPHRSGELSQELKSCEVLKTPQLHRIEAESYSKILAPPRRSGELSQELKLAKSARYSNASILSQRSVGKSEKIILHQSGVLKRLDPIAKKRG